MACFRAVSQKICVVQNCFLLTFLTNHLDYFSRRFEIQLRFLVRFQNDLLELDIFIYSMIPSKLCECVI